MRAETQRIREEARRRYVEHLAAALLGIGHLTELTERASAVLDALTEWIDVETGEACGCSCHPRLPTSDLHDFGFACRCRKTAGERGQEWDESVAEIDAFWSSPEGRQITARHEAEERELLDWLARHPDVEVRSHGGCAPERYFRERHDRWRIELDLRPTGRFATVWRGGDLDDDSNFEPHEIEEGDVIAEGSTAVVGYGDSPTARLRFIVGTIRNHLRRRTCTIHTTGRAAMETTLGFRVVSCPACGIELALPE